MPLDRRSSQSSEEAPLLEDPPPSYHATDDVDDVALPIEDVTPMNKFSRTDTIWILAGVWLPVLLGAFDGVCEWSCVRRACLRHSTTGTVVATLLTPIGSQFEASNQASYIGTSYLLSVCCFTPLYGRLADILGRKGAMLLALSLFGSGTIFCGLAPSMGALITARTVAGMGGGGVMTVASITVSDLIPLKQRGLYQGIANLLYGLGAGLGGPVGGWANDKFGWRYAFYMQAPLLLFSFIVVATKVNIQLPSEVQNQRLSHRLRRIDILGSITLVGMVSCLLLGLSVKTAEELPWSHPLIYGLFIAGLVFLVLFILIEKYWAPYPVMPLRLMMQRTPLAVSISNFLTSMAAFSMLYNVPLYFSVVRLDSAAVSGLHLVPHSIAIPAGSFFAGWIMRKTGRLYTLTLMSSLLSILASILVTFWNANTSAFHLWVDLIPQGFGMASFITSTLIAMMAGVYKEDMPVATGITYLFRTTGQVVGVSLSSTIFQAVLLQKLRERIQGPGSSEDIDAIRRNTEIIPTLDPLLQRAAVASYADALWVVFVFQIAIGVLGFLACLPIQENPLPGTREEQEQHYQNRDNPNHTNSSDS